MARRRRSGRRGSAMVEGALVIGLFLMVFIGIFDFAQIMYLHQALTERVRGAARAAIVEPLTETEIRNFVLYGKKEPAAGQTGYFGLEPKNVRVTIADKGTNEQRLKLRVAGLKFSVLSPWMSRVGHNLPITVSTPLEEP